MRNATAWTKLSFQARINCQVLDGNTIAGVRAQIQAQAEVVLRKIQESFPGLAPDSIEVMDVTISAEHVSDEYAP